jgi:predicted peptidase
MALGAVCCRITYSPDKKPCSYLSPLTTHAGLVSELLQDLHGAFSLGGQRFYVVGQSMGGFGTWSLISQQLSKLSCASLS